MALAGRSARRGSAGSRVLIIGVVITLLVLLIDASLKSRSPSTDQQLAVGAWVDRALPVISSSNQEGDQLAALWSNATQSPSMLASELDQIANGAAQAYKQVLAIHPPNNLTEAAGLLDATLDIRSQAMGQLRTALQPVLTGSTSASGASGGSTLALSAIQKAGNEFTIADEAYQLFLHSLPPLGVTMPPSAWASNSTPYQPSAAQVFLTTLQNALSTTPVHELKIYSVNLVPQPVGLKDKTQILPDSVTMDVTVVVADVGNQPEKGLTVTASIAPAAGTGSVRDFLDLTPGQAGSIVEMGPLNPPQGVPVTLTIVVNPPAGSTTPPVYQTLTFEMPGQSPLTTTSVPATTSPTTSVPTTSVPTTGTAGTTGTTSPAG